MSPLSPTQLALKRLKEAEAVSVRDPEAGHGQVDDAIEDYLKKTNKPLAEAFAKVRKWYA